MTQGRFKLRENFFNGPGPHSFKFDFPDGSKDFTFDVDKERIFVLEGDVPSGLMAIATYAR